MKQKNHRVALLMLAAAIATACGEDSVQSHDVDLSSKVLYLLDGNKYSVPLGYHWWTQVKKGHWPEPKSEYSEVKAFAIDALLPDLAPYSPANSDSFDKKVGPGNVVAILVQSRTQAPVNSVQEYLETFEGLKAAEPSQDVRGLLRFVYEPAGLPGPVKPGGTKDIYVRQEPGASDRFVIICDGDTDPKQYPSCRVSSLSSSNPDLPYVTYTYGLSHLPRWDEIHAGVVALVSGFRSQP